MKHILLVTFLLVACKKSEDKPADKPAEPAVTKPADKPADPPPSTKPVEIGTFFCKEKQDGRCTTTTDTFDKDAAKLYMTHNTTEIPKNGDVYTVKWIAEDVGTAAPANTVIDSIDLKVDGVVDAATSYTVNTELSQPTKGWPVGSYRVEITKGDKPVTTAKFKIQ